MKLVPQLRPRYIAGYRVHHGLVGLILTAIGLLLMLDDLHDFPWSLRD